MVSETEKKQRIQSSQLDLIDCKIRLQIECNLRLTSLQWCAEGGVEGATAPGIQPGGIQLVVLKGVVM